jgi:uncharacterized protein
MAITLAVLLLLFPVFLNGKEVPQLTSRVMDQADLLSSDESRQLENLLAGYENDYSVQMVLYTTPSLEGENLELYSIRVVTEWKLGQEELDNGALLLISMQEKKVRIEVGYGLESVLTDLKAGYIIDNILVPRFKKGEYFQGIRESFVQMGGIISREYDISEEELAKYQKKGNRSNEGGSIIGTVIFLILFLIIGGIGGGRGRRRGSGIGWFLLGSALGGSSRGSGSGGGFGGFSGGGGSFGGGGASGGW